MRKNLRLASVFLAALLPALAAIDGTIVKSTSGQPQPGVIVMLTQPGQAGMSTLGTVKSDAGGSSASIRTARADRNSSRPSSAACSTPRPFRLACLQPECRSRFTTRSPKIGSAQVAQDLILLQPSANQVAVNESIFFENKSQTTFNDPKNGTLHFYLPPEANDKVSLSVTSPGGIPVNRAVKKGEKNVYSVDYPIRPGETRFDLTYTLVAATQPLTFSSKAARGASHPARRAARSDARKQRYCSARPGANDESHHLRRQEQEL